MKAHSDGQPSLTHTHTRSCSHTYAHTRADTHRNLHLYIWTHTHTHVSKGYSGKASHKVLKREMRKKKHKQKKENTSSISLSTWASEKSNQSDYGTVVCTAAEQATVYRPVPACQMPKVNL